MADTAQQTWDADDTAATDVATRLYELGFHLVPTTPTDELASEVSRLKERIEAYGGTCTAEQSPQRVELAYPIEQRRRHGGSKHVYETAFFGWLIAELTPDAAYELNQELQHDTGVLRHLLVQTTQAEVEHSKEQAAGEQTASAAASEDATAAPAGEAGEAVTSATAE